MFLFTIPLSLTLIFLILNKKATRFIFNKIDDRHWPSFISSAGLFLLITVAYSVGRRMKDAVIGVYIGPEITNIIKLAIILPLTIFLVFLYQIYSREATQDKKEKFLSKMFIGFSILLAAYGVGELMGGKQFFDKISPSICLKNITSINAINNILHLVELLTNNIWSVLIYVLVEMYGLLILSISFWTFIAAYMTMDLAKVFYPYIMLLGSLSGIISGVIGNLLAVSLQYIFKDEKTYACMYNGISFIICALLLYISSFVYKVALREFKKITITEEVIVKKKRKVGALDGFKALKHPVIISVGTIVFCYMVCVILLEIPFKKSVLNYYIEINNRAGYDKFMSTWQILSGGLTIIFSFICQYTLSRSWLLTALSAPILLGVSGMLFFLFFTNHPITNFMPRSAFATPVMGMIQTALAKSLKYASIDGIKETALLSIKDKYTRENGKFSIESFGNKLGKGFGSLVQSVLIIYLADEQTMFTTSLLASAVYTKYIYMLAIGLWIIATLHTNKYMKKYETSSNSDDASPTKPQPANKTNATTNTPAKTNNKKLNNDN